MTCKIVAAATIVYENHDDDANSTKITHFQYIFSCNLLMINNKIGALTLETYLKNEVELFSQRKVIL